MRDRKFILFAGVGVVVALLLFELFFEGDQLRWVLYLLIAVIVLCGAIAAILWTARLERSAKRSVELDHLKSEVVSRVAHELRTPLTTIKTLTRLLLRGEVSKEKQREYLETISVECDRQIDLILNLLDLSRIEGGVFRLELEKVDVKDVLSSCVKSERAAAERRSHTLRISPFAEVPPLCADPKILGRVICNLVENSIKYTPDGGLITLSADADEGCVDIRVSDNGQGIRKENLPHLFDKFYRGRRAPHSEMANTEMFDDADSSGVGLGLYLARDLMKRMGGKISVETEVGKGSTFTLRLPVWKSDTCGKAVNEVKTNVKKIAGG